MLILAWLFLALQAAIVVGSLLGFGIFTARPDLLAVVDPEARFFVWAFHGFAVLNMLLGGAAVVVEAFRQNHWTVVRTAAAVYLLSLGSELLGTGTGFPFGAYAYTDLLGPKWFDKVPLLIPLSWFTMAWPAWILACRLSRGWLAVVLGTALLVAWDLVLDPAMSSVTTYWIWAESGSYYGMPWSNLLGWAVTGLVLIAVLAWQAADARGSLAFAFSVYAVNLALPFGFCVLRGYWLAVAAGSAALLAALLVAAIGRTKPLLDRSDKAVPLAAGGAPTMTKGS
jgi:putative membrane protein